MAVRGRRSSLRLGRHSRRVSGPPGLGLGAAPGTIRRNPYAISSYGAPAVEARYRGSYQLRWRVLP